MKIIELPEGIIVQLTAEDLKTPLILDQVQGDWQTIINNAEGVYRVGNEIRFVYITNNQFFIEFQVEEAEIQNNETLKLLILQRKCQLI